MSSVDPLYAQWLLSEVDHVVASSADATARWGDSGKTTERVTPIAYKGDARVQAERELAFFSRGPFAIDVHEIVGVDWIDALGSVITLSNDRLDYADGAEVFVFDVQVDHRLGISTLTVIKPLGAPQ